MYSIPTQLIAQDVIDAISQHGFDGTYHPVCMPPARQPNRTESEECEAPSQNIGYAFIQFKTPESAAEFLQVFQNFSFSDCSSEKLTCTRPANFQPANCQSSEPQVETRLRNRVHEGLVGLAAAAVGIWPYAYKFVWKCLFIYGNIRFCMNSIALAKSVFLHTHYQPRRRPFSQQRNC